MALTQHELMRRWFGYWDMGRVSNGMLDFTPTHITSIGSWTARGFQRGVYHTVAYRSPKFGSRFLISTDSPFRNWQYPTHTLLSWIASNMKMKDLVDFLPLHLCTFGEIDLESIKVIHKQEAEVNQNWWTRKVEESVFTGSYTWSPEKRYFLSGYDGQEPIRGGTAPRFVCELVGKPKTVDEAYESLKPRAVKKAIAQGLTVVRQGDIFAICLPGVTQDQLLASHRYVSNGCDCLHCRNSQRRVLPWVTVLGTDHTARRYILSNNLTYASGSLIHRDHNQLPLGSRWWLLVRNTVPLHDERG